MPDCQGWWCLHAPVRFLRLYVLRERYRQAKEYMEWFQPAWDNLSEDERYVLEQFYWREDQNIYTIFEHFGIERSSAYNKKNRAVQHLTLLLYGKA